MSAREEISDRADGRRAVPARFLDVKDFFFFPLVVIEMQCLRFAQVLIRHPATRLWLGGQYGEEGNKGEDRREEEGTREAQGRREEEEVASPRSSMLRACRRLYLHPVTSDASLRKRNIAMRSPRRRRGLRQRASARLRLEALESPTTVRCFEVQDAVSAACRQRVTAEGFAPPLAGASWVFRHVVGVLSYRCRHR
jgi:hypothetical protein